MSNPVAEPIDRDLTQSTGISNPLVLIDRAIEKGVDAEFLEKLFTLQERWERNRAAEAFAEAVTRFQSLCPAIFKSRQTTGKIVFNYASYDDVMRHAGPILAQCGIAVSFTTEPATGDGLKAAGIKATCRIRVGIHQEETTLTLPVPAGVVNDTQLFGQAVSYAKRYALCAALNIVVTDEDRDGQGLTEIINDKQFDQIQSELEAKGGDLDFRLKALLDWAKVESLDKLPVAKFEKALESIRKLSAKPVKGGGQ